LPPNFGCSGGDFFWSIIISVFASLQLVNVCCT
jgi:hypothetical protein